MSQVGFGHERRGALGVVALVVVLCAALLTGCSSKPTTFVDLWTFSNISSLDDTVASFDQGAVERLVVRRGAADATREYATEDYETIESFLSALSQVKVGGEVSSPGEEDVVYSFELADGSVREFPFRGSAYVRDQRFYETKDTSRLVSLTKAFVESNGGES